jgi:hypothetical protein
LGAVERQGVAKVSLAPIWSGHMPIMSGPALAAQLEREYADLPVV